MTYVDSTTSGNQNLRNTGRLYVYDSSGDSIWLNIGNSSHVGGLTLHYNNTYYGNVQTAALTANRTYTLPDKTGTVALTSDLVDTKTTQSATTTANWRKVLLHYKDDSTSTAAVTSSTAQVYAAVGVSVQPSTGTLRTTASQINEWNISEDTTTKALVFKFVG